MDGAILKKIFEIVIQERMKKTCEIENVSDTFEEFLEKLY